MSQVESGPNQQDTRDVLPQDTLKGRFSEWLRNPDTRERAKRIALSLGAATLKKTAEGAVEGFVMGGGLAGAAKGGLSGAATGAREGLRSEAVRSEVHGAASDALGTARDYAQGRLENTRAGDFVPDNLLNLAHTRAQEALNVQLGVPGQRSSEQAPAYHMPPAATGPR